MHCTVKKPGAPRLVAAFPASAFSSIFSSATPYTVSFFCLGDLLCAAFLVLLLFLDFLPSYLFTALSSFSWVCWIAPNNAKVNQLFGISHGLAMGIPTFDWGQISFAIPPFPTPWWAAANTGLSVTFFYWFLAPILYVRRRCLCISRFFLLF